MTQNQTPKNTIIGILHVANWLQGKIADILTPHGVSLQQLKVLAIVYEQKGHIATVGTIRDQMQDPMSNVSRLLNKLMEKNLVRKEHGTEDQRVVHIHLTSEGVEVMRSGRLAIDEGLDVLCHLSSDELDALDGILAKIKE